MPIARPRRRPPVPRLRLRPVSWLSSGGRQIFGRRHLASLMRVRGAGRHRSVPHAIAARGHYPFAPALFQVIHHAHHRLAVALQCEGDRGNGFSAVILHRLDVYVHGVEVQVAARPESIDDRLTHGVGILYVAMTGYQAEDEKEHRGYAHDSIITVGRAPLRSVL